MAPMVILAGSGDSSAGLASGSHQVRDADARSRRVVRLAGGGLPRSRCQRLTQVQFKPDDGSEAMALLSQVRLAAATNGAVVPLRISFGQTLALVSSLWWMVAVGEGVQIGRA